MIYILLACTVFVTDGVIKYKVEKERRAGEILPVLGGKLWIRKFYNTGAMLGAGAKNPKRVAGIAILFTVFMSGVYVATLGYHGKKMLKAGLSLLLGGAYSNTYDRIVRKYVVDYVSFPVKNRKIRNIVFNISDFAIMTGSLFICISALSE